MTRLYGDYDRDKSRTSPMCLPSSNKLPDSTKVNLGLAEQPTCVVLMPSSPEGGGGGAILSANAFTLPHNSSTPTACWPAHLVNTSGQHIWSTRLVLTHLVITNGQHVCSAQLVNTSGHHRWSTRLLNTPGQHKWSTLLVSTNGQLVYWSTHLVITIGRHVWSA